MRTSAVAPALGPDAVAAAVDELRGTGAEVLVRPSPGDSMRPTPTWRPSGSTGGSPPPASRSRAGRRGRRLPGPAPGAEAAAGELAVTVDHADLLVLP